MHLPLQPSYFLTTPHPSWLLPPYSYSELGFEFIQSYSFIEIHGDNKTHLRYKIRIKSKTSYSGLRKILLKQISNIILEKHYE